MKKPHVCVEKRMRDKLIYFNLNFICESETIVLSLKGFLKRVLNQEKKLKLNKFSLIE
jgi:hypothetical protein